MKRLLCALALLASVPAHANQLDLGKIFSDLNSVHFMVNEGMLQMIVAKELCSCRYVTGLTSQQECLDHNKGSLPSVIFKLVQISEDPARKMVVVRPTANLPGRRKATAVFRSEAPQLGCSVKLERTGL